MIPSACLIKQIKKEDNIMNTDEFYQGAANGTLRHATTIAHPILNKTNIFWYEPSIFTTCGGVFTDTDIYDIADNPARPVRTNAKKWKYDANIKLCDVQNKTLSELNLKDIRLGQPYPNKAACVPYVVYERKHYYGIGMPFQHLNIGTYNFKIREVWTFKDAGAKPVIIRNLTIPVNVDPRFKPYDYALANQHLNRTYPLWYINWYKNSDESLMHMNLIDHVNRNLTETKINNFKFLGKQSIALNSSMIPRVNLNLDDPSYIYPNNYVTYSDWYGTPSELADAYKKHFPSADSSELAKVRTIKDWSKYSYSFIKAQCANLVNAHTAVKELNHENCGCTAFHPYDKQTFNDYQELRELSYTIGITN